MLFGYQASTYPFLENYSVTNNNLGLVYYGGFGYGVSGNRSIVGGFGYAIMDVEGDSGVAGGFGGFIYGFRLIARPIHISINSWTGFGGLSTGTYDTDGGSGFFALIEEITVDLGLPLVKWFMPTVYVGYQIAGNLIPGRPFNSFFIYTPVIGLRIQWGDFY